MAEIVDSPKSINMCINCIYMATNYNNLGLAMGIVGANSRELARGISSSFDGHANTKNSLAHLVRRSRNGVGNSIPPFTTLNMLERTKLLLVSKLNELAVCKNIRPVFDYDCLFNGGDPKAVLSKLASPPKNGITFTEEYFGAGLNLLSYFNTYLLRNYPSETAKISILQDKLTIYLTIETPDGSIERIEALLSDYIQGISGRKTLEEVTTSGIQLIEMKQQIRLAEAQIDFQRDLLGHKEAEIERLQSILLESVSAHHSITVNPVVQAIVSVKTESPQLHRELRQIEKHLKDIDNERAQYAARNVEAAADAAEKGDEDGVRNHLKAVAKYVVETSTKIGTTVASAYFKSKYGW